MIRYMYSKCDGPVEAHTRDPIEDVNRPRATHYHQVCGRISNGTRICRSQVAHLLMEMPLWCTGLAPRCRTAGTGNERRVCAPQQFLAVGSGQRQLVASSQKLSLLSFKWKTAISAPLVRIVCPAARANPARPLIGEQRLSSRSFRKRAECQIRNSSDRVLTSVQTLWMPWGR